jgi:hypothetical protein
MDPLFSFLFGLAVAALFFTAGGFLWWIHEHQKRLAAERELALLEAKIGALDRMHSLAAKDNLALIQKLQQQGHYIAHLRMMLNASSGISIQGPCHIEGSDEDEEISGLN